MDLPAVDCEPASMADCYKGAATCADYFWTLCFDRWEAGADLRSISSVHQSAGLRRV